jgi:hypothetical protein
VNRANQRLAPPAGIGYQHQTMTAVVRVSAPRWPLAFAALASVVVFAGCSASILRPTAAPTGEDAPVTLRDLQIDNTDGHRTVLLRLSRVPTAVRHSSSRNPAEITVEAWGPLGDGDFPERNLPQSDDQIRSVRVSRNKGTLTVVLDLQGNQPPPYSVHEMADWIMIRLGGPQS